MSNKELKLQDNIDHGDVLSFEMAKPGFKTDIRAFNELGEQVFRTENRIVLGGALFVLEKVFGVTSPLTVDYLNNIMGIATTGTNITEIYPKNTVVCLFGVGIGGAGESIASVKDVSIKEREIVNMIPFRVTDTALSSADAAKYFFKKDMGSGRTGYYLKKFESTPTIKALWKDAEGDEDGTEVTSGVHSSTRTEPIESFVEIVLKINKNDCREWFEINGNVEQTRINSIGLFTGIESTLADGSKDYKQVKLFSKLNINNEMLDNAKELTVVYRIYTSS